jgi:predicted double-glycine peptidase
VGKLWTAKDIAPGLYIVLQGKVRLLAADDEMIAGLNAGQCFGEYTLGVAQPLHPYIARAGVNVQICFLPQAALGSLLKKHSAIGAHLQALAEKRCGEGVVAAQHRPEAIKMPPVERLALPPDRAARKISKAYFPNPAQRAGHLWQRVVRRYPFYAQQSSSDCGAACLVMVARYWGKKFSVNRLRDIAHVDRNGSSLKGLSAAAESVGFNSSPVKASLDRLAQQPLPAIVHWEGKHYIVVYAVTKKQVIVGDPAIGQRILSHQEFKKDWTGFALILQPTALLKEAEEATTPFWQFFELLKPHSLVMFEIFVASLLIQIFGLVTPLFTQLILDRVVVQKSELTLVTIGLGLFAFPYCQ